MICGAQTTIAAEHIVAQKNKAFSQPELTVKVGDTVQFRNDDDFFHNVFSLSDIQFFDLGSYATGEAKPVTFETPGTVDVECAIHPEMQMKVHVQP
ncbi:MAG: plastocyanin/azurin family copper-binding protein [Pseudomonadota bacterium]